MCEFRDSSHFAFLFVKSQGGLQKVLNLVLQLKTLLVKLLHHKVRNRDHHVDFQESCKKRLIKMIEFTLL